MRATPTRQAIYVAFFACLSVWSGCSQPSRGTISLFDQIPEDVPAGPWRVVADLQVDSALSRDPARFRVTNLKVDGNKLIQTADTSSFRLEAAIRGGENVYIRLTYRPNLSVMELVQASLYGDGSVRQASVLRPEGSTVIRLQAPESATRYVTIVHRGERRGEFPLESVMVVAADRRISESEKARLQRLLSISKRDFLRRLRSVLASTRFPLELEGSTHEGMVLVAGDTLLFHVPHDMGRSQLRFWTVPLEGKGLVWVEAERRGHWIRLDTGRAAREGLSRWLRWEVSLHDVRDCKSLRFVVPVKANLEAFVLAEPVIIPHAGTKSGKKNLIVIDLDTMRMDRLGCYGYGERPTSVRLDSVMEAKGFFLFERAYSSASWTLPATARFLTSRYMSCEPWVANNVGILPTYETLAEILRTAGYYCAAFTGGGQLRKSGFERGFHEYSWTNKLGKAEETIVPAIRWLIENSARPFLLFIHTYEPHEPYTRDIFCDSLPRGRLGDLSKDEPLLHRGLGKPPQLTRQESLYVQAVYDGGIRKACDTTADLFATMEEIGLWENTAVVVLSDHGEEFWDHSSIFGEHGRSLYGELLNVPFLLYSPELSERGIHRIQDEVGTIDLVPTVADLLDIPFLQGTDGISLIPLLNMEQVTRALPIISTNWRHELRRAPKCCVISERAKYIERMGEEADWVTHFDRDREEGGMASPGYRDPHYPHARELFLLAEDPHEKENLLTQKPAISTRMRSLLKDALVATGLDSALTSQRFAVARKHRARKGAEGSRGDIPEDLSKQLRQLGYLESE